MTKAILAVSGNHTSGFEFLVVREIKDAWARFSGKSVRTSPVFPVLPNEASFEEIEHARFVVFICPKAGFQFIGSQLPRIQKQLWFSHGVACAVMFSEQLAECEQFVSSQKAALNAYEIWSIGPSRKIQFGSTWLVPSTPPQIKIQDYSELDTDGNKLVQEIEVNVRELMCGFAQFMPEQVPRLECIVEAANQIILELLFYEKPDGCQAPEHLKAEETKLKDDAFGRHRRINQCLTQLIQLNSALAYIVSQGLHGAVPVLARPCLVPSYALLGVGTAYRALTAVSTYVERVFEECPVLKSIEFAYRKAAGFEVFPLVFRYRPEVWREAGLSLDNSFLPNVSERVKPKAAYFSARLGFGESRFSVTAAAQVLHGADSKRWSLMTMTHELLHAHVTGLLATILGEAEAGGMSDETFRECHAEFLKGYERAKDEKPFVPKNALDSIRFAIFSFATARANFLSQVPASEGNLPTGQDSIELGAAQEPDDFKRDFLGALRLLEEVVVHTLDLRYFHAGDQELFITLLWESWTTVPAVVGDLDTYLLRTLGALAALETGTPAQRYNISAAKPKKKLSSLLSESPENEFLRRAVHQLETKKARLVDLFYPTLYVADMTAIFLHSTKIQGKFWSGDNNIDADDDDRLAYNLAMGEFSGTTVTNPIPFLADRMRRSPSDSAHLDEEYRSAWLLMATASASQ